MIRYKFNVYHELCQRGITSHSVKRYGTHSCLFGQATMQKFKALDTNISLDTLNRLCLVFGMRLEDIVEFVMDETEKQTFLGLEDKVNAGE